jgi:type I restriction enzyme, S subunit
MSHPLPTGWASVELENYIYIAGRIGWRGLKRSEYTKAGPRFLAVKNILPNGTVDFSDTDFLSQERYDESPEIQLKVGDILLTKDGTIGKVAMVGSLPGQTTVNSSILVLRPKNELLLSRYLFHFLRGPQFQAIARERITGSAIPHLFQKDIKRLKALVAPLNEQCRIVAKLERLMDKLDSCQTRLAKIPLLLKKFRQAVLAAACSGKLTADWREHNPETGPHELAPDAMRYQIVEPGGGLPELPETWQWTPLGNYGRCTRGRFSLRPRNDPSCFGGKHPFIQIGDLPTDGGWIRSHTQTLNEKGLAVSKTFPKGTAVIAIVGATIGNTGLLAYDMCFTDSIVGIETGSYEGNRYVELFLRNEKYKIRHASYSSGGQPNIKLEFLNPYPLALPPLAEQEEIVRRVDRLFSMADVVGTCYDRAKSHVDNLRQSILAKAFRGELVSQDPNDEPAVVLLERIPEARVSQNADRSNQKGRQPRAARTKDVAFVNSDSESGPETDRKN